MLLQAKNRGGWDAQYLETQEMRYTKRAPAFIILPDETPGGKPLWKALCEVGQASCSLQRIPGSARTSFIRAHQNHVDVHSISSGTEQKRKLQKKQLFCLILAKLLCQHPKLSHSNMLKYLLAQVTYFLPSHSVSTDFWRNMFSVLAEFPFHWEYRNSLISNGWTLAVLIETFPFFLP